jgi:hypothetical protein
MGCTGTSLYGHRIEGIFIHPIYQDEMIYCVSSALVEESCAEDDFDIKLMRRDCLVKREPSAWLDTVIFLPEKSLLSLQCIRDFLIRIEYVYTVIENQAKLQKCNLTTE